jgi:VIT1/CCC1 family predicted Fe2+/Mn2+ transporter
VVSFFFILLANKRNCFETLFCKNEENYKVISKNKFWYDLFRSNKNNKVSNKVKDIFVIQKVQPALLGLMDGSVSTLAPIFATAGLTGKTISAFYVGLAASLGAGISMGLAEALSDDGTVTGRGNPWMRGAITALATAIGGMLHTLPFLIPNLTTALHLAYAVVVIELLTIAFIRYKFMKTPLAKTVLQVIVGGMIVFGIGIWLGGIT